MERFVRLTAPTGKVNFILKLLVFMLIGGALNHLRHMITHGFPGHKSYWDNFTEAAFTALPMCTFALLLIGHLNSLQKRLYEQATRDPLTELPNRRWFMAHTPDQIGPGQALMIVDIDHFKLVNDRYGHDVGDICLRHMADHLQSVLGPRFDVARIGGEEFAVFATNTTHDAVADAAQKISEGFEFDVGNGVMHRLTNSVGIATHPEGLPRTDALRVADQATYAAKSRGRACFVFLNKLQQGGGIATAI